MLGSKGDRFTLSDVKLVVGMALAIAATSRITGILVLCIFLG